MGVRHDFMVREFSLHAADRVSNGGHRLAWLPEARKSVLQLDRTAEVFPSLDEADRAEEAIIVGRTMLGFAARARRRAAGLLRVRPERTAKQTCTFSLLV